MSYDFALVKTCSHFIFEEELTLLDDRRTLHIPRIPANKVMELKVDGEVVPPSGLWSPACVVTRFGQPFEFTKNVSDLIMIKYKGETRIIELPAGQRLTADSLVDYLKMKFIGYKDMIVQNLNGHLCFRNSVPYDGEVFSFIDPKSFDRNMSSVQANRMKKAYETLGIVPGKVAYSIEEVPGYTVSSDPITSTSIPSIIFNDALDQHEPIITLTYQTHAGFCYRCGGSSVEHDYVFDVGAFQAYQGINLLAQEMERFFFTDIGSHFKWGWYGSNINEYMGAKFLNSTNTRSMIQTSLSAAFDTYKSLKTQQSSIYAQKVADEEFPFRLVSVDVTAPYDDPTALKIDIIIQNKSLNNIYLTRDISTPLFPTQNVHGLFSNSNTSY